MAINIKLVERSYGGKKFRPSTIVDFEPSSNLLICVTPWGRQEIASKVTESMKAFIATAKEDTEMTVPYAQKDNLQQMGNILRMATIMASEKIYSEFNDQEYTSGFEIFAAIQDGPQWNYISCGQPSLILHRKDLGIVPLTQSIDLNVVNSKSCLLDPLPNQLLGLGQHPPIQYGNIRLLEGDQLALISRTYIPTDFYKLETASFHLDGISRSLANNSENVPFWLGLLSVNQI